ncbi:MAG TPA: Wzz/FepE/Etk N-terminal domain-containing protein [Candidatus Angelobacter sp.]
MGPVRESREKFEEKVERTQVEDRAVDTLEGAEAPNQVSLLDILIVLGRQKTFLLVSTAAIAISALAVTLLIPKKYTAVTTVLPSQQNSSVSAALLSQMGNLGALGSLAGSGLGVKNPADMTISLLKSRSVEDALVRRFDLMKLYKEKRMSDARKALEDHCTIDSNVKDGLVRIAVEDHSPERAAEMANGYVEEYRAISARLAITEASQRRLFFEQQLEQAKSNLATAEETLKTAEQKTGMIQLDSQTKALIESVAKLKAEIATQEVLIRSMSSYATAKNPDLQRAREQLAALQEQLRALAGSKADVNADVIVPRGKLPEAGLDYVRKLRDVKYYELIFELLAKQFEMAKLDEAREGAVIQVVDPAVPPDRKSFPKVSIIVPAVSISWVLLAIFGILLREGIARAKKRPEDLQRLQMLKTLWQFDSRES